jgi:hypothetical protein
MVEGCQVTGVVDEIVKGNSPVTEVGLGIKHGLSHALILDSGSEQALLALC